MGMRRFRQLVRSGLEVHVRQAGPDNYRSVLQDIKQREIFNIVVDTKPDNAEQFLRGILQLQMNDYKYHYIFTTFDIETFDLDDFKYNFVNMTAFRMVDVEDPAVHEVLRDMETFRVAHEDSLHKTRVIKMQPALMYDSVYVFAIGLQSLEQSHSLRPPNVSCEVEEPWDGGLSLINYINTLNKHVLDGKRFTAIVSDSAGVQFDDIIAKLEAPKKKTDGNNMLIEFSMNIDAFENK